MKTTKIQLPSGKLYVLDMSKKPTKNERILTEMVMELSQRVIEYYQVIKNITTNSTN